MASPDVDVVDGVFQPTEADGKVTTIASPEIEQCGGAPSTDPHEANGAVATGHESGRPIEPALTNGDNSSHNAPSYAAVVAGDAKAENDKASTEDGSRGDDDSATATLNGSDGAARSYAAVVAGEYSTNGKESAATREDEAPYPKLPTQAEIQHSEREAWEAGGIRFAPLRVPLTRRMQTAAVLFHCMSMVTFVSCFWFSCANPLIWPLLVPYLIHLSASTASTDGSLRYRSEWLRSLPLWRLFAGYFPMTLHKTHELPPDRKYIFGYHPHGIISHGAFAALGTNALGFSDKFPGITNTLLTLDSNFRLPFYRDWILALGLRSVSKESIWNTLTKGGSNNEGQGRAVTIVIGGARESLEAEPGTLRLILKGRKGFVKMALRTGADLVPVIAFGENDIYDQLSPKTHPMVHKLQMFILKVFKFTVPALHGRGVLNYDVGLLPYRRPVNVVVGKPIHVNIAHGPQPEQSDIDRLHDLYIDEVEKLWEAYKDQFAKGRTAEMQIFS